MSSTPNTNTNTNTFTITPPPKTTIVNTTPYPPTYYKTNLGATTSGTSRDYRKGNWTLEETLILIKAKKLDNERRTNNNNRGGELRWKWIENYCWNNGCFRSQNQCNDKWDNLLRDYKKVREYVTTYWLMDKNERKYRNLPSNMLLEIYQELNEVIEKKKVIIHSHQQQQLLPPLEVLAPPLPTTLPDTSAESSETQGERGDKVDTETKRRRARDIRASILHSNTLLSQTLKEYDEKREKRHRELMELEQQRLHLEETRNEANRQGIAGLVASVKKLSDAIHVLISEKHA